MTKKKTKSVEELQAELNRLNAEATDREKKIKALTAETQKATATAAALAQEIEETKKASGEDLESKFAAIQQKALVEIENHVAVAKAELKKALAISEQTGVPFESPVVDLSRYPQFRAGFDVFVPKSFVQTWSDLYENCGIEDFLYDMFGVSPYRTDYDSFDHGYCIAWAPSTMRC